MFKGLSETGIPKEGDFSNLKCQNLIVGHGAEDIATTEDGLAFITSGIMYPPFR